MTITEFLLARIEEEEGVARACLEPANMHPYGDTRIPAIKPEEWGALVDNYLGGPMGTHCARHDPSRVLAECAAKRRIVDLYEGHRENRDARLRPRAREAEDERAAQERRTQEARTRAAEEAVLSLAAVYKDHPDYRQEWAL